MMQTFDWTYIDERGEEQKMTWGDAAAACHDAVGIIEKYILEDNELSDTKKIMHRKSSAMLMGMYRVFKDIEFQQAQAAAAARMRGTIPGGRKSN